MPPLISVVIPCYRQAHFLTESIASLQAQTYPHWEAIIVNDGSPDNTAEVAAKLCSTDGRVRHIAKANGGLSSARNAGIRVARGSLIQFLDADDLLEPDKFRLQTNILATDKSVDLVYGNAIYFQHTDRSMTCRNPFWTGSKNRNWIEERAFDSRSLTEKLISFNLFAVCCPLIRTESLERVGLFDESLPALEDWEYWTRCSIKGLRFLYSTDPATQAIIRVHETSMTHETLRMQMALVSLRLTTLSYIEDRYLRILLLANTMPLICTLPSIRDSTFTTIDQYLRHWDEKIAILSARSMMRNRLARKFIGSIVSRLPWRWKVVLSPLASCGEASHDTASER